MHPFPPASRLQFLVGKEVLQVVLGFWRFQFDFDGSSMAVEGDFEHVDSTGTIRQHNNDADRLSPLCVHHLLGQAIQHVAVEPFCLTLTFTCGDKLRVFSDEGQFECGQICDEEGELIVF